MQGSKFIKMRVENTPGVLDRVTGIIRRHGWNIESLAVGEIRPGVTEMNFAINGKSVDIDALSRHLGELDFVESWEECTEATHLFRETVVIKLRRDDCDARTGRMCTVIEQDGEHVFLEYSGKPDETADFIAALGDRVLECDRSGALAVRRV